jgi:hypothetical protein
METFRKNNVGELIVLTISFSGKNGAYVDMRQTRAPNCMKPLWRKGIGNQIFLH